MIKSHQKAVHTNGYRINYKHTNSAHSNGGSNGWKKSGYNNHSDGSSHDNYSKGGSGWTMSCGWYANHTNRDSHSNGGYNNHTNGGYNNHTNKAAVNTTAETSRTPTNTTNKAPQVSGSTFSNSRYYNSKSIKVILTSLKYSDDNTSATTKFRIYYQYCASQNGTYGNWTLLSEQTSTSYTWVATSLTAGWYKIGVTVYDNGSWSAIPSGNGWTYHHIENHATNAVTASNNGTGYSNVRQDTTAYETTYAAVSSPIRIYHYTAPTWNTDYYTKPNEDQVQGEVNNVLSAMGQTNITFTNSPVVSNFTIITWQDILQMREGTTTAYNLRTGSNPTYSTGNEGVDAFITNQKIIDIQDLLTELGQGD